MTRRILLLLFALALVGVGCSDDDTGDGHAATSKDKHKSTTTTVKRPNAATSTTAAARPRTTVPSKVADSFTGGDKTAYCKAWADLNAYFFFPPSSPDDVRKVYSKYGEISARLVAAGPKEIKDELQRAQEINAEVVRSGATNALDRRETKAIVTVIQTYSDKQCA